MPQVGQTIDHFRLLEHLGSGGMGSVFLAEDVNLGRKVALKFLARDLVHNPEAVRRFRNEARAAAELRHPNLATLYGFEAASDEPYLAMEYLEGSDLREVIRRGPLDLERLLFVGKEIARGLTHAHERGVIHRDIKSANVFVTNDGEVKILDFGLAHRTDATRITQAGTTLGTVGYMSPEQLRGSPADARSDIWSAGAVLYECASGLLPFQAESLVALGTVICNEAPPPPRLHRKDLPPAVERILLRCLEKDPKLRYQHADDLLADLRSVERSLFPEKASRVAAPRPPRPFRELWRRHVPLHAALYAAVVLGAVALTDQLVSRLQRSPHLVDAVGWGLVLMAPSVLILSWRRGGPCAGGRPWTAADLWTVPLNATATVLVLLVGFQEKDLGSINTEVNVRDQAGVITTRVVPKVHFRRHVAVFFFEDRTGQPGLDWLSYAFADLLQTDLSQNVYMELRSPLLVLDRLRSDGYRQAVGLPRAYQRDVAKDLGCSHFVTGYFDRRDSMVVVEVELHDTRRGRSVARHYEGADLLFIVDAMSRQIQHDLEILDRQEDEGVDLDVSEIESSSPQAIERATRGMRALYLDEDPASATTFLEDAVAIDPTYASAQLLRFVAWTSPEHPRRDAAAAAAALDALQKHLYRLPERQRLVAQSVVHLVQGDLEECEVVTRMRVQLYPEDVEGWVTLARLQKLQGMTAEAVASFEQALDVDPSRLDLLLQIGELQRETGDLESAEQTLERYATQRPADAAGQYLLGQIFLSRGRLALAREAIQRAVLLDPGNTERKLAMGAVHEHEGEWAAAQDVYQDVLRGSSSREDSMLAHRSLSSLYQRAGRAEAAAEHAHRVWQGLRRLGSGHEVVLAGCEVATLYAQAGQVERAAATLEMTKRDCPAGLRFVFALGSAEAYLQLGDLAAATQAVETAESTLDGAGNGPAELLTRLQLSQARLVMAQRRWQEALQILDRLEVTGSLGADVAESRGRCARELGRPQESVELLQAVLEARPPRATAHLEMAFSLEQLGDLERANEHVDEALALWRLAADSFPPREQALVLRERLGRALGTAGS